MSLIARQPVEAVLGRYCMVERALATLRSGQVLRFRGRDGEPGALEQAADPLRPYELEAFAIQPIAQIPVTAAASATPRVCVGDRTDTPDWQSRHQIVFNLELLHLSVPDVVVFCTLKLLFEHVERLCFR